VSGDCIGVHRQNKSARHPGGVGGGAEHVVRRSSLWFGSSLESPVQRTHTVTVASKRSLPPVNRRCSRSGVLTLCVIARDGALFGAGWRVSEGAWNTTKSNMAGYRYSPFWLSGCAAIYFAVSAAPLVREKYWRAASLRTTIVRSHCCSGYVYQVTLRPGSKQDPRELSVTGHRVLAVGSEHLNPDVVRACLEMGMHARSNGVGGAV